VCGRGICNEPDRTLPARCTADRIEVREEGWESGGLILALQQRETQANDAH
jgi:hypothetical protein